jgi:two-component system response regulator
MRQYRKTPCQPVDILLVEDNPGDVELTTEALDDAKLSNRLYVVTDGVEAMAFLRREGKYAHVCAPDLILLDLNLPRKNGREVLAEIKADPDLKIIPIVVLTTSSAEEDILKAYNLNANSYVVKPVGFDNFMEAVRSIRHFWFSVVTLPPE